MIRYSLIGLLALALIAFGLPVRAQESAPPLPLAAIQNGDLWLFGLGAGPQQVTSAGVLQNNASLTWGPQGNTLAFTMPNPDGTLSLMLTDRAGSEPVQLASGVAFGFPISFTAEGEILYAVSTQQYVEGAVNGGAGEVIELYTVAPQVGAAPELIGSLTFGVGCGGGSSIPADWMYWTETGTNPGGSSLVLALTPHGLVHSINCTGVGTALLDLASGESTPLGTDLGAVKVSPDGSQVVGVNNAVPWQGTGQTVQVDVATGTVTTLSTSGTPDQLVWSADGGSVFYSTRRESGETVAMTPEQQQQVTEALGLMEPVTLPLWTASIHRLDLAIGQDTELYSTGAYAIGRMLPTPDGSALIFSQIPNLEAWAQTLASGQIADIWSQEGQAQLLGTVAVDLLRLDLNSGAVDPVGTGMQQAALIAAAYGELAPLGAEG
jgi:hypothetical protein